MSPDTDKGPVQSLNMPETQSGPINGRLGYSGSNAGLKSSEFGGQKRSIDPRSSLALPDTGALATAAQSVNLPQQQISHPASSTDDDMSIEKEVIAKAKAIVQRTSQDPYMQAKEIGKVRAELLKRRYGKEIKVSEG